MDSAEADQIAAAKQGDEAAFDGISVHLEHHDVALVAISRAPVDKLIAYRQRMGWSFPWVSSAMVPPPRRISGVILYCMLAGN